MDSIGGNHFIHACRRNVDILYLVMDNRVYGMTKGQPSPTTEPDWDSALVPGGTQTRPFNPVAMAITAGASFVARGFAGDPQGLSDLIVEAIRWPGFAFLEVLSPCVTFRPKQFDWKAVVRHDAVEIVNDRGKAAAEAISEDGFSLGVLFKNAERCGCSPRPALTDLTRIENTFRVGS